jgi:hypothetical protein
MKKAKSSAQRKRTAVKDLATRKAGGVKGGNVVPTTPGTTAVHVFNGAVASAPRPGLAETSSAQTAGSRG